VPQYALYILVESTAAYRGRAEQLAQSALAEAGASISSVASELGR
jgi:hypothetical protein